MTRRKLQIFFKKVMDILLRHSSKGEDTFPLIAEAWDCSQEEAAIKMAQLKIARILNNVSKEDSYIDAIGYLTIAYHKYLKDNGIHVYEHQNDDRYQYFKDLYDGNWTGRKNKAKTYYANNRAKCIQNAKNWYILHRDEVLAKYEANKNARKQEATD